MTWTNLVKPRIVEYISAALVHNTRPRYRRRHPPPRLAEARRSRSRHSPHSLGSWKIQKIGAIQQNSKPTGSSTPPPIPNNLNGVRVCISYIYTHERLSQLVSEYRVSLYKHTRAHSHIYRNHKYGIYPLEIEKREIVKESWSRSLRVKCERQHLPGENGQEREGKRQRAEG